MGKIPPRRRGSLKLLRIQLNFYNLLQMGAVDFYGAHYLSLKNCEIGSAGTPEEATKKTAQEKRPFSSF